MNAGAAGSGEPGSARFAGCFRMHRVKFCIGSCIVFAGTMLGIASLCGMPI
jgi:hypothetical protein